MADINILFYPYAIDGSTPNDGDTIHLYLDGNEITAGVTIQSGFANIDSFGVPPGTLTFTLDSYNLGETGLETGLTLEVPNVPAAAPLGSHSPTFFLPLTLDPTIIVSEIYTEHLGGSKYDPGSFIELYNTTDFDIKICDSETNDYFHIQICPSDEFNCNPDNVDSYPIIPIKCIQSSPVDNPDSDFNNDYPNYYIPSKDRFLLYTGINSTRYTNGWNNTYPDIFNYSDGFLPKVTFKSYTEHPDGNGGYTPSTHRLKFQLEHYFDFTSGRCEGGVCVDGHWDGNICSGNKDCGVYSGYTWDIENEIVDDFLNYNDSFTIVIYNGNPNSPTESFPGEIIYQLSQEINYDTGQSKEFIGSEWENSIVESENPDNWFSVPEIEQLEYSLPFPPIKCEDSYIYNHTDVTDEESFTKGNCQNSDKWYLYNYGTLSCVNNSGQIIEDCPDGSSVGDTCDGGNGTCYGQWLVPNKMVFRSIDVLKENFSTPLQQNYFSCTGDCLITGDCVDNITDETLGIPNVCEPDTTLDCVHNYGTSCTFSDCSENECDNLYTDIINITDSCGDCITPECFNSPDGNWMSNMDNLGECTGEDFYTNSVPSCINDLLTYDVNGVGNDYDNGYCGDGGLCVGGYRNHVPFKVSVNGNPCTQDSDCGEYNWFLYGDLNDLTFNNSCHGCRDENGGYTYNITSQEYEPVTIDSRPDTDCRRIPGGSDNICCNYYVELWLQQNPSNGLVDLYIKNKKPLTYMKQIHFVGLGEILSVTSSLYSDGKYGFGIYDHVDYGFSISIDYLESTPLWENEGIKFLTIEYDTTSITSNSIVRIIDDDSSHELDTNVDWYTGSSSLGYSTPQNIFVDCDGNIVDNPHEENGNIGCDGVCTTPLCNGVGDTVNCGSVLDSCGTCNGGCDGTVGGDNCLDCGCNGIPGGYCDCDGNVDDCAGDCGGSSLTDMCGVCNDDPTNDCTQDCTGTWGGLSILDECGVCDGDNSSCTDCSGILNGTDVTDLCGKCVSNTDTSCILGCDENYCNGVNCPILIIDECTNCNGDCTDDGTGYITCGDSPNNSITSDCLGICGGNSVLSGCDNTCNSTLVNDVCDDCGGDGSTCCNDSCEGETPDCDGFGACGCDLGQDCMDICGGSDTIESYCPDSDGDGIGSDSSTSNRCTGLDNTGWILVSSGNCTDTDDGCQSNLYDGSGTCCPDGTSSVDSCDVCDGDNSSCSDCNGTPNGIFTVDSCSNCTDPSTPTNTDCNGVCNGVDGYIGDQGTNGVDVCTVCGGDGSTCCNNSCTGETPDCNGSGTCECDIGQDCMGVCGGDSTVDLCGVCNGSNSCLDCGGIPNGDSLEDNCSSCNCGTNGTYSGTSSCIIQSDCTQDCNGDWGGSLVNDSCGVCNGDNSSCTGCTDITGCNYNSSNSIDDGSCIYPSDDCHECDNSCGGVNNCVPDCDFVCGGDSYLDCLGNCSTVSGSSNPSFIGNTGELDGFGYDCGGYSELVDNCNGTSITDCGGFCCGGNSGNDCYVLGCNSVCYDPTHVDLINPGGPGYLDECGICGGNGSPCITISMGNFTLVDDGTFGKYSIPLNMSHTSDIGKIEIPFEKYIYNIELSQTPTLDSGYEIVDIPGVYTNIELSNGGFSTGQNEFTLMTLTYEPVLNFENHPSSDVINDYVSSIFSINPFNGDEISPDNTDINIHHIDGVEYSDDYISLEDSYRKRMVFGCTDILSNNCNTVECGCSFYGFNDEFCTTQSCTPLTHSGQGTCDDVGSGENCCCTYPELSISKLVHDSTDYTVEDYGIWGSNPFNILDGNSNLNIGKLSVHWNQSGWDGYSASSSDYPNKRVLKDVIFPYSFCVDEFDGGLISNHSIQYNCESDTSCGEFNNESCTWTNTRSKYEINIGNGTLPVFTPSDWFPPLNTEEPQTGEYTVRIMWPLQDLNGNPITWDTSTLRDSITFNISREGCTNPLSYDCNFNHYSTEDNGTCIFPDTWGTCCPSTGSCNDCNNLETTYRWYRDNDMDGYGCSSSYQDLCPSGRSGNDVTGYSYSYPYGNPWESFSTDKWLFDSNGNGTGDDTFWSETSYSGYIYNLSGTSITSYLRGTEFSDNSCGCVNKFYCCNDSVVYTSPLDNSLSSNGTDCIDILYEENTCNSECGGGFTCREIHYTNDVCGYCGVDWDGDGVVNIEDDTRNECENCPGYTVNVTLDDEVTTWAYNYDTNLYDCHGTCSGTAVFDDQCLFCWGGNTGILPDHHYDYCNNCQNRYICINYSPIILSWESNTCDDHCDISNCQRMSTDYNDFLTGESNNNGYFWGLDCTSCDGTPSVESDSMWDSCNICCQGITGLECNVECSGEDTPIEGCPNLDYAGGETFIIGPNTGCSGECNVLNEFDDLGNCCTVDSMINFFPDMDVTSDNTGESGFCLENPFGNTNISECEGDGNTWVYTNALKICENVGNGPIEYDGSSTRNCITDQENGNIGSVYNGDCNSGWVSQININGDGYILWRNNTGSISTSSARFCSSGDGIPSSTGKSIEEVCSIVFGVSSSSDDYTYNYIGPNNGDYECDTGGSNPSYHVYECVLSSTPSYEYYSNTDNCFGYIDNCGDCWSFEECPTGIDGCELYNSGMDCRNSVESCGSELPYFIDECGTCMSPDCTYGDLPNRWEILPADSITKNVCDYGYIPGNSEWNSMCTGCTEAGSTNYSGDYNVICDNNTNLNENYCSGSSNFIGCCCHYDFNENALSVIPVTDEETGANIVIDGYTVHSILQNGVLITPPEISWSFNGPGHIFYEHYSFDIYRNNNIGDQQCSDDYIKIGSVDAIDDYPDNSGNYSFIDFFELEYNLTPTSELWLSYYVVVNGQEDMTVTNYLGWPDYIIGSDECGEFDDNDAVYISDIQPSVEIISSDCSKYICDYSVESSIYSSTDTILIKIDYSNIPFTLYDSAYNNMKVSLHGGHYTCSDSGGSYTTPDCEFECGDEICEFILEGQISNIGSLQELPVDNEWVNPFDGSGNSGDGYYCSKYNFNDVQYETLDECEIACGEYQCDTEHHLLFNLTTDIWDTIYESGYYFIKVEYPSPLDDPIYLDTLVSGREFMFYINVVEGCMDNSACTCETCPGLCGECDYVCDDITPGDCYDDGFFNPSATVGHCMENIEIPCHNSNSCTCTYECTYPVYGCMDDGFQKGGICTDPVSIELECTVDDDCDSGYLCGCDGYCHLECFIEENNDSCSIYGGICEVAPSTYISNQSHSGSRIFGSVKNGESALNLNKDVDGNNITPTIESTNCIYDGCIDDDAVNFVGSYYDGGCSLDYDNYIDCYINNGDYDVPGWNGDVNDCIYGFQYRLKYQLMINNEFVKLPNNGFQDYIDLGICNECTSDGSDNVLDIQLPMSSENIDMAPEGTFGDPEYKLILSIEGSSGGEGYVWLNTENQIGGNIYDFIHQSGEESWVFPDDIEINGSSGMCYDTVDPCGPLTETECDCVPKSYSFIIPEYCVSGLSGCTENSPETELNQFTVTLSHPDDPSITISKTLNVRFIRNNYGVYFELPPLSNITMNVDEFGENEDGELVGSYEYTIILKDLDGDPFVLNSDIISGGSDLTVIPQTISSSDIDENGVLKLNLIAKNKVNSYTVKLTVNQNENPLQVPEYACVLDGNIIDGTEGGCIPDQSGSGDVYCNGIVEGSLCEWISVPMINFNQVIKTFTVDVIDTRGPDGDISIKPVERFGISNDTYNYRPVGMDNRYNIGGQETEYQIPTEYILPSITYSYGEMIPMYVCTSGDNSCTTDNECIGDDNYCINNIEYTVIDGILPCAPLNNQITIYYGDPSTGGILQSEYELFTSEVMDGFYTWYTDNIDNIYEGVGSVEDEWTNARENPLGYSELGGSTLEYNCFEVTDINYTVVFETDIEITPSIDNPNRGGWIPINAYHSDINPNGNKNDVVWKYELDIQQDEESLDGFPKIFQDWDDDGSLNCQGENCFSVPPNDYTGLSNIKNFINSGFTFTFLSNGIYTIIMRAYDILYTSDENAGTNVGESIEILNIDKVIPIVQTVSNNYLPWQGINIPNNSLDDIINSKEILDFIDIDKRKSLGCFYYDEDNSETLLWEEISKDRYTGNMGVSVDQLDTNPNGYSDPCSSQYEYEQIDGGNININFDDVFITRGELKSTLFFSIDNIVSESEWKVFAQYNNISYPDVFTHYIDVSTCDDDLFGCKFYDGVTIEFNVYISDIKFVPTQFEWTDGENNIRGINIYISEPSNGWQVGWNQISLEMGNIYLPEIVNTESETPQATNWGAMNRMEIYRSGCDGGYLVNEFTPDVDVRTPISLNGSLSTPIKYYDANLHKESYRETSSPVEVQFYFYKRLDGELFANRDIIDFPPEGDTYIGFVDWDDGSIIEHDSDPFKLGNGKSYIMSHSYERGGIYNITGYMFTVLFTNAIEGTDILGVNGFKKFTVTININESSTDIYIPYESENNETKSTPIIGGVSEYSIYSKTIKRQLGYIGDSNPIHLEFDQYYDRLYTEYALSQISDKYIGNDMSYYMNPVYDGNVDNDGNLIDDGSQELIFNGMFKNIGELGDHPGDVDIGNFRYYSNGYTSMSEMIGFYSLNTNNYNIELGENLLSENNLNEFHTFSPNYFANDSIGGGFWKIDYYETTEEYLMSTFINVESGKTYRESFELIDENNSIENVTISFFGNGIGHNGVVATVEEIGESFDGHQIKQVVSEFTIPSDSNETQIRAIDFFDPSGNYNWLAVRNVQFREVLHITNENDDGNTLIPEDFHPGNPSSPRYWKNIIPEDYTIYDREGINLNGDNIIIDESSPQKWSGQNKYNNLYYYPVLPKLDQYGKFNDSELQNDNIPFGADRNWNEDDTISPITNELFRNSRVEINFTFDSENDGIIEDKGGFNNIGIFISDYRVKFNEFTKEPEDTDVVSISTIDVDKKAF
jgi:hypothetical protein